MSTDDHNLLSMGNYFIALTDKSSKLWPESVIVRLDNARNMYFHLFRFVTNNVTAYSSV